MIVITNSKIRYNEIPKFVIMNSKIRYNVITNSKIRFNGFYLIRYNGF